MGYIVKNSTVVPESISPFSFELNIAVQTKGSKDWHSIFGFPKVGFSLFLWDLGNTKELGRMAGVVPNITFNTQGKNWYSPRINLGLGLAFFEKQYNYDTKGPVMTPKYAIYTNDIYLSKRYGKVSNMQLGLELNHCNSFYH